MFEVIVEFLVPIIGGIALVGILIFLCIIPLAQMESRSFIKEFQQMVETVEVVRAKNEMPEADVMITANRELAKLKFYNSIPIIGWTITDKIEELRPIE
jgi:hypothetical protein